MVWFGVMAYQGIELPEEYNTEMKPLWFVSVIPGLLLIIYFIAAVFESVQSKALVDIIDKNKVLKSQKETIASQSVELEKLIEDKDHIIRILAHDLKNPLANITSLIGLLEMDGAAERRNEYISMINQSSTKAQDLIKKSTGNDGFRTT